MVETAVKKKQKIKIICDPLIKGDEVYLSPEVPNGALKVTRVKKEEVNEKIKDPADKTGKKMKTIKVTKWRDIDKKTVKKYISLYWKFNYLGTYKDDILLEYLEGPGGARGRIVRLDKEYKKFFLRESPKINCGEPPDRRPLHMVFTIIEEDKIGKGTATKIMEQKGKLEIGLKTSGKFKPLAEFSNVIMFTEGDAFSQKEGIYVQIPTYQYNQNTYLYTTPYSATWFKIFEFPLSYGGHGTKKLDPYTRYMHIGNASDGCATVKADSVGGDQGPLWTKIVKRISSARIKGPTRLKQRVRVKKTNKSKTATVQVYAMATLDIVKKLKPKPKLKKKKKAP